MGDLEAIGATGSVSSAFFSLFPFLKKNGFGLSQSDTSIQKFVPLTLLIIPSPGL